MPVAAAWATVKTCLDENFLTYIRVFTGGSLKHAMLYTSVAFTIPEPNINLGSNTRWFGVVYNEAHCGYSCRDVPVEPPTPACRSRLAAELGAPCANLAMPQSLCFID